MTAIETKRKARERNGVERTRRPRSEGVVMPEASLLACESALGMRWICKAKMCDSTHIEAEAESGCSSPVRFTANAQTRGQIDLFGIPLLLKHSQQSYELR
jgi:hypothetical protein